jgi:hypothetical protein
MDFPLGSEVYLFASNLIFTWQRYIGRPVTGTDPAPDPRKAPLQGQLTNLPIICKQEVSSDEFMSNFFPETIEFREDTDQQTGLTKIRGRCQCVFVIQPSLQDLSPCLIAPEQRRTIVKECNALSSFIWPGEYNLGTL